MEDIKNQCIECEGTGYIRLHCEKCQFHGQNICFRTKHNCEKGKFRCPECDGSGEERKHGSTKEQGFKF